MSRILTRDADTLTAWELRDSDYLLSGDPSSPIRSGVCPGPDEALLSGEKNSWLIVAGPGAPVAVNGLPLILGVLALRHKDSITLKGKEFFYSEDSVAVPEPLPEDLTDIRCALCTGRIEPGSPSVACPACGSYFHEDQEGAGALACWSSCSTCVNCHRPVVKKGETGWLPNED